MNNDAGVGSGRRVSSNALTLTDGFPFDTGSAFFQAPISTAASFNTHFQFQLHGGTPAPQGDGITFALTDSPFAVGDTAPGGFGYDNIGNSVAVAFDADTNEIELLENGSLTPVASIASPFALYGNPVNVWLTYNYNPTTPGDSTLSIFMSQGTTQPSTPLLTTTVEIDTFVGNSAFVGFTGGTFVNSAVQDIDSWQLTSPVGQEGETTPTLTLATFTDPGNILPAGEVLAVNVTDPGSGYVATPTVIFDASPVAGGTASGIADVYNGEVTGVIITDPGFGYTSAPEVSFSSGNAGGTAVISQLETSPADYSVMINWGDGNGFVSDPSVAVSAGDPNTGVYTITGAHAYAEEGDYTVTIEVTHDSTPTQTISETVVIADVPLEIKAVEADPQTVTEGSTTPILVGTFTDAGNPKGLAEDYSADINFGDGAATTLTSAADPQDFVSEGGGKFNVYVSHVYEWTPASDGSYTLTATIHHEDTPDAAGQPISDAITVTDPALVAKAGPTIVSGTEGSSTNLALLATVSDPGDPTGTSENPTDYVSDVSWGDNATNMSNDGTNSVIIVALGDGNYAVEGSHVYAEQSPAGGYSVSVSIAEADNAATLSNTVTDTAIIADTQLTGLTLVHVPTSGLEGADIHGGHTIYRFATFTDPGGPEAASNYKATITWGDGTTSPALVEEIGATNEYRVEVVGPTHTYAEEDTYEITVTVQHGAFAPVTSAGATITIADQQIIGLTDKNLPSTGVAAAPIVAIAPIATFTDPAGQGVETTADFTASIQWATSRPSGW